MKTTILCLSLCLSFLTADETLSEIALESIEIDTLKPVKEQLAKARKKGWDFEEKNKSRPKMKKDEGMALEFKIVPDSGYQPMQQSEAMINVFRSDLSVEERCKQMERIHEMDRKYQHPGKKNNSR